MDRLYGDEHRKRFSFHNNLIGGLMKCPCCNRVIRVKKPKTDETLEEAFKRLKKKVKANISANLRKPMPTKTRYKD
jgi:hypothetical protein